MRIKIFLVFLLILLVNTGLFGQYFWQRINSPTNYFLRTLHFTDSSKGWVAGDSGLIFYTSNGGLNWEQQQTGYNYKIMKLFFLDENQGWAVAWDETGSNMFYGTYILKTTNGGETWNSEQYREEYVFLATIYFLDSLKGFMGGYPGKFLITTDGGSNWENAQIDSGAFAHLPPVHFNFFNEEYGFAAGGALDIAGVVWKTTNGGQSWKPLNVSSPDPIRAIHFFDSLQVIGIGGDPEFFGIAIIRSTDAGESWTYEEPGLIGVANALSFRTETEGWAPTSFAETVVYSFDSGNTWEDNLTPYCSKIYDIVFTDSLTGYGVGEEGVIIKYAHRPDISYVTRNPIEVGFGEPVNISASISELDGIITGVELIYRQNQGIHSVLPMINTSGNVWEADIPAFNDSTLVDFFIRAVDDDFNVTLSPVDTSFNRYFFLVLNRALTIQDIQFSPFGSGNLINCEYAGGASGYKNYEVTVRGIVTADTSDIQGDGINYGPAVYIQNGAEPWSGIWIEGTETYLRKRGDDITVTGIVEEYNGVTRISGINNPSNITIHSLLNPLPPPVILSTGEIDQLTSGILGAEQWEGVLVGFEDVIVTDENADGDTGSLGWNSNFGEILVTDITDTLLLKEMRVNLKFGAHHYHNFWEAGLDTVSGLIRVKTGDTLEVVKGIVFFSSENYKLIPRRDDDFDKTSSVVDTKGLPQEYFLSQNYPNPFNSTTKINYALPIESKVTIKIFNVLGQEVSTLIHNEIQLAGEYTVIYDASNLSSGIYFYRLQSSNFNQVMKMMLLK